VGDRLETAATSLTRPRQSQLIDFLLGLVALTAASAWVGQLYAPLGLLLFAAVTVGYLVSLRRTERAAQIGEPPPTPVAAPFGVDAAERLTEKLEAAIEIPLTGEARIEAAEVAPLLAALRNSTGSEPAHQLAELFASARPIPFTDQVRFDRRRALQLLDEARASAGSARSR
jgi:hypothetical protein